LDTEEDEAGDAARDEEATEVDEEDEAPAPHVGHRSWGDH